MDVLAEIGFAAGEIYFCGIDKPLSVTEIKKRTKKSDEVLYMSIGWLAREGKVELTRKGKEVLVRKIA